MSSHISWIVSLLGLSIAANAQQIINFGEYVGCRPFATGAWEYMGSTSTTAGANSMRNVLDGTFSAVQEFRGPDQINLTALFNGLVPASSFLSPYNGRTPLPMNVTFTTADATADPGRPPSRLS